MSSLSDRTEGRASICFYTRSVDPSGMGAHMLDLIEALVPDAQVWLLCRATHKSRFLLDRAAEVGARPVRLPSPHSPAYPRAITAFLRAHRVDLFHGHAGWGWDDAHGFRLARAQRVPAVLLTHHLPFLFPDRRRARRLLAVTEDVDAQIAVSEGVRATYERVGVPPQRLTTVPNGVRPRGPGPGRAAARRSLGLDEDRLVVMTAGRLVRMKGQEYLVEAAARLRDRFPRLAVVILGRGGLLEDLGAQVRRLGLDSTVQLPGHRPDARMLLDAADVFALPSRAEGMPLVLLEAMDAGLPVLATRVIGSEEVVTDGVTGSLAPSEDVDGLTAALAGLLADPGRRARYGAAGRRRYLEEFTVERMVERTWAVYERLLAGASPAAASVPGSMRPRWFPWDAGKRSPPMGNSPW